MPEVIVSGSTQVFATRAVVMLSASHTKFVPHYGVFTSFFIFSPLVVHVQEALGAQAGDQNCNNRQISKIIVGYVDKHSSDSVNRLATDARAAKLN